MRSRLFGQDGHMFDDFTRFLIEYADVVDFLPSHASYAANLFQLQPMPPRLKVLPYAFVTALASRELIDDGHKQYFSGRLLNVCITS